MYNTLVLVYIDNQHTYYLLHTLYLGRYTTEFLPYYMHTQEEENARLATAKRRLQREIDELTEQNEALTRDLAAAKKRLGSGGLLANNMREV